MFYNNTVQGGGLTVRVVDGEPGGGNQVHSNILFDGTRGTDQDASPAEVIHDYGITELGNPYGYFTLADFNLLWRSDGAQPHIGGQEQLFAQHMTLGEWQAALEAAGVPLAARQSHSIVSDPQFVDPENDDYRLAPNGQPALTASNLAGPVGCYITGFEEIGLRAAPEY